MKKVLFAIALLSVGTTLVNAMTPRSGMRQERREQRRAYGIHTGADARSAASNETGADEDEISGCEEHEGTKIADENGY